MQKMKITKWIIVCLLALSSGIVSAANLKDLLSLHGKEYIKERNELLEKGEKIKVENRNNERMNLLADILNARKANSGVFKQMEKEITMGYDLYERTRMIGMIEPRMCIKPSMQVAIEKKEYVKSESPTGNFGDLKEVKHTQTDEEVAKAKEMNRARRLAVIEYLWKISDNWRVDYELSDVFIDESHNSKYSDKKFDRETLPVLEDLFQRSTHFLVLENCAKIFINSEYKQVLPLVREKLDQCFKEEHYLSCLVLLPALEKFGDEKDVEKADELRRNIPLLVEKQKREIDMIVYEMEKRIKAQQETKQENDTGLRLD